MILILISYGYFVFSLLTYLPLCTWLLSLQVFFTKELIYL